MLKIPKLKDGILREDISAFWTALIKLASLE
jgi:hypothetical protein